MNQIIQRFYMDLASVHDGVKSILGPKISAVLVLKLGDWKPASSSTVATIMSQKNVHLTSVPCRFSIGQNSTELGRRYHPHLPSRASFTRLWDVPTTLIVRQYETL